ncbi:BON domain-containing protein [Kamptonema sp. UHCC 0994]|uniref:BON domain-containing protein n=1 Tax=Kamptonema sp. UHCC 0994 TaxID=3031329 RepID=UPI0023BA6D0A|nr:BON domain-containing protein [Kamptonema sp. UHCC 0994]MDF0556900.1 BON domain-containing protein [Kamptonema sp. UHCC 0994]
MKKLTPFLLSGILLLGVAACDNVAKSSANAPNSTQEDIKTPDAKTVKNDKADATSETRRAQADSDIRAREQRNNITGGDTDRANRDLESEVRSKLEVNITGGQLTVAAKDGAVTISGTVPNQKDLDSIEPLTKEIKGVNSVTNKAVVATANPDQPKPSK